MMRMTKILPVPLPSILKKPKPLKLTEESRVEISPGLFTKRPSKSSEKVEKVEEINLDLDQSPKLPSLKTVNLNHLLNEKSGNKKRCGNIRGHTRNARL